MFSTIRLTPHIRFAVPPDTPANAATVHFRLPLHQSVPSCGRFYHGAKREARCDT